MVDEVPADLIFDEPDLNSLPKNENVLKLVDPPEKDNYVSISNHPYDQDNIEKDEMMNVVCDSLLDLEEPPRFDSILDKLSESFADSIKKEAVVSEVEDVQSVENGTDINYEKVLSYDSFINSKDDVSQPKDIVEPSDESDELKQDLDDIVYQEEMRLESSSEEVKQEVDDIVVGEVMGFEVASKEDISATNDKFERDNFDGHEFQENDDEVASNEDISPTKDEFERDHCYDHDFREENGDEDNLNTSESVIHKPEVIETVEANISTTVAAGVTTLCESDDPIRDFFIEKSKDISIDDLIPFNSNDEIVDNESCGKIPLETEPYIDVPVKDDIEHSTKNELQDELLNESYQHSYSKVDNDIIIKCKDIISWTHPLSSAVVFSILMLIELGLIMGYSIISLLAYSGLIMLAVNLGFKIAISFRFINTQSSGNCDTNFKKEDIEYCVDVSLGWVDYVYHEMKSIAYVESLGKNIKVLAMFWVLTYVGNMFNLQSLILIATLLLFTAPVVYSKYKTDIDVAASHVRSHVCQTIKKVKSLLPVCMTK